MSSFFYQICPPPFFLCRVPLKMGSSQVTLALEQQVEEAVHFLFSANTTNRRSPSASVGSLLQAKNSQLASVTMVLYRRLVVHLYSQYYFPSLDYTLSFHVGVMARIMARQRGAPDDAQKSRLTPVWRRWEQAAETLDSAEEAEDFQAVGMKCRECLIQLARSLAKPEMVPEGKEAPQRNNFNEWAELIANAVAHGGSAERIRGHMKTIAKSAWELVGWLTHANNATRQDAIFVVDATHTVMDAFGRAAIRHESGVPERCPKCASYNLDVGFNPELPRPSIYECEECGWQRPEEE
jgi:hypothetical protein